MCAVLEGGAGTALWLLPGGICLLSRAGRGWNLAGLGFAARDGSNTWLIQSLGFKGKTWLSDSILPLSRTFPDQPESTSGGGQRCYPHLTGGELLLMLLLTPSPVGAERSPPLGFICREGCWSSQSLVRRPGSEESSGEVSQRNVLPVCLCYFLFVCVSSRALCYLPPVPTPCFSCLKFRLLIFPLGCFFFFLSWFCFFFFFFFFYASPIVLVLCSQHQLPNDI